MKHVFVFDPKFFHKQQWLMDNILDNIGLFFQTQGSHDFSIQVSHFRRDAIALIQKEADTVKDNDTIRVYAVGGDEILYDCMNGIADLPNTELAAVPYGEINDFFRVFGERKEEWFRDIPYIAQRGEAVPIDIINWGVNYALNSCSIGASPAFMNNIQTVYDRQTATQHYKITIDDNDFSGNYSLIHIANGPFYSGRMTGLSKALPNDGLLDVAMIKSAGPLRTMWALGRFFRGKVPSNCVVLQAKKITVQADRQMQIQLDNEFIRDTGISIKVVPGAVQIVTAENLSRQQLQEEINGQQ